MLAKLAQVIEDRLLEMRADWLTRGRCTRDITDTIRFVRRLRDRLRSLEADG